MDQGRFYLYQFLKSFLDCNQGKHRSSIYEGHSAYSCLTKLPNGNIGLFFEAGEHSPYERMVFRSFEPDMLFTPEILLKELGPE